MEAGSYSGMVIESVSPERYPMLQDIADGFVPNPATSKALIAKENGEVVGRVFLLAPAHVEGIWVRDDKRSTPLGKQLMEAAESEAKQSGITRLMAYGVSETESYLERLGYSKMPLTVWGKTI